jgi:hypothetical protein
MQEPIAGLQAKKSEGAVACTLWLKKRDWLHERSSSKLLDI